MSDRKGNDMKKDNLLTDDMLENVSGGRTDYSDDQLKSAGVIVEKLQNQPTKYYVMLNGKKQQISRGAALSGMDCFLLAGKQKLTPQQWNDLIAQS